jgi:hypothetical protein
VLFKIGSKREHAAIGIIGNFMDIKATWQAIATTPITFKI